MKPAMSSPSSTAIAAGPQGYRRQNQGDIEVQPERPAVLVNDRAGLLGMTQTCVAAEMVRSAYLTQPPNRRGACRGQKCRGR